MTVDITTPETVPAAPVAGEPHPAPRRATVPVLAVWTLRVQVEIVLIYAGLVKLNSDWLGLEPLGSWLAENSDFPLIGHLFPETWVAATAAYGTIALHLVGGPLLLWRPARIYVFAVYCAFHAMNHFLFHIGIFPWMTMAATLLFFDPDWPRQLAAQARALFRGGGRAESSRDVGGPSPATAAGGRLSVGRRLALFAAALCGSPDTEGIVGIV